MEYIGEKRRLMCRPCAGAKSLPCSWPRTCRKKKEKIFGNLEGRCFGSFYFFEEYGWVQRVRTRRFHLPPGCIRSAGFVCFGGWFCFCWFFVWVGVRTAWAYEILLVYLWTVAYRCLSDGDCMLYSLCDLVVCVDDVFPACFGCFCIFHFIWNFVMDFREPCMTWRFERLLRRQVNVFHEKFPWWFCWIEVDVMNLICMFLHDSSLKKPSSCAELPL